MDTLNRREFVVAAGAACACLLCPAAEALAASKKEPVAVGRIEDFPTDRIYDRWAGQGFFIVRHKGKLYACSSACTHKTTARLVSKETQLVCPKHGSLFAPSGAVTKGPARRPLPRFGITKDERGRIIVDRNRVFEQGRWDDAASFLAV